MGPNASLGQVRPGTDAHGRRHRSRRHRVSDVERSRAFYEAALAPLGWHARPAETDPAGGTEVGFGRSQGTQFAIHTPTSEAGQDTAPRD
jgi:catechol 2,3-dioxygenase-like lactoylglutathione lyase family enzyme